MFLNQRHRNMVEFFSWICFELCVFGIKKAQTSYLKELRVFHYCLILIIRKLTSCSSRSWSAHVPCTELWRSGIHAQPSQTQTVAGGFEAQLLVTVFSGCENKCVSKSCAGSVSCRRARKTASGEQTHIFPFPHLILWLFPSSLFTLTLR